PSAGTRSCSARTIRTRRGSRSRKGSGATPKAWTNVAPTTSWATTPADSWVCRSPTRIRPRSNHRRWPARSLLEVTDAVERYLACMAAHDWDGLAATVADDVTRDGPFCDCIEGKQRYVEFLRGIITSLEGYQLHVQRVSHVSDRVAFVELTETFG